MSIGYIRVAKLTTPLEGQAQTKHMVDFQFLRKYREQLDLE